MLQDDASMQQPAMPEKHSALHGLAMGLSVTANPDGTYSQAAVEEISQRLPIASLTVIPGAAGLQPGSNTQRVSQLYFTHIVGDGEESEGKVGQLKFACTTACNEVCAGSRERPGNLRGSLFRTPAPAPKGNGVRSAVESLAAFAADDESLRGILADELALQRGNAVNPLPQSTIQSLSLGGAHGTF